MACTGLLIDYRALLIDHRALFIDHRSLLIEYRALLIDHRARFTSLLRERFVMLHTYMIREPYVKASCHMWMRRFTRMNLSCLRFNQGCVYVCVCTRTCVCVCVCVCWDFSQCVCVTWLIHRCDMAHLYLYHVVSACVTCDTHTCDMWHTHVCLVTHTHTCFMWHTPVCYVELSSCSNVCKDTRKIHLYAYDSPHMRWLRLVGPLKS